MGNKCLSCLILFAAIAVAMLGIHDPQNTVFSFISENKLTDVLRVALAAAMVGVSFRQQIFSQRARHILGAVGICLLSLGFISLTLTHLQGALYSYLRAWDLLLLAEAGVMFTTVSLASRETSDKPKRARMA
jgi:hypothetical protein